MYRQNDNVCGSALNRESSMQILADNIFNQYMTEEETHPKSDKLPSAFNLHNQAQV